LLQVEGLAKSFPGVRALDEVSLAVHAGEVHALMGENGAGKSTLIKLLTGVHRPDAGVIRFDGRAVRPTSPRQAEALGISTVHQEISLIPHLSVAENIMLGREPRRFGLIDRRGVGLKAQQALARLELRLDVTQSVAALPPALQQLVAIARALAIDARLLILDEPTSSLDTTESERLFAVMRRLREQGLAILFVTHFLDQVYAVSDRITVLRNGRLVGQYAARALSRLALIEAMLGLKLEQLEQQKRRNDGASERDSEQQDTLLETRQLERRGVVGPIDVKLRAGEVVGLAGLLGSGRSETARMLFGIDPADRGELSVRGRRVALDSPRRAIRAGLAYCPEERKLEGLLPNLSVRENLILAMQSSRGALHAIPRPQQDRLVQHYIAALSIKTPSQETPIQSLSGGNQQKVLLARWMAMQAQVIILDEPTRGVDIGAKLEIEELVRSLSRQGVATLLISSELEEVARNCSRVVVLRDRKQVADLAGARIEPAQIIRAIAEHPARLADA